MTRHNNDILTSGTLRLRSATIQPSLSLNNSEPQQTSRANNTFARRAPNDLVVYQSPLGVRNPSTQYYVVLARLQGHTRASVSDADRRRVGSPRRLLPGVPCQMTHVTQHRRQLANGLQFVTPKPIRGPKDNIRFANETALKHTLNGHYSDVGCGEGQAARMRQPPAADPQTSSPIQGSFRISDMHMPLYIPPYRHTLCPRTFCRHHVLYIRPQNTNRGHPLPVLSNFSPAGLLKDTRGAT